MSELTAEERLALWSKILLKVSQEINRANFVTWFKNTAILSWAPTDGILVIGAPTPFAQTQLQRRFQLETFRAAKEILPGVTKITFEIDAALNYGKANQVVDIQGLLEGKSTRGEKRPRPTEGAKSGESRSTEAQPESQLLNRRYTLDSFIVGDENRLAFAASKAVAQNPGKAYNPLFIYGGVGLGKTHLLQAIGNALGSKQARKTVIYTTSEVLTNEFVNSMRKGRGTQFKYRYRNADCLIIDDVQFLANKVQTQIEVFHTFNTLYELGKQIVLSSDRPPREIKALEERLRSRFEMGMIADIQPPAFETKLAILRSKAQESGQLIPSDILEYVAEHAGTNVRELEGLLTQVVAQIELTNHTPTLSSVRDILRRSSSSYREPEDSGRGPLSHDDVLQAVAEHFDLSQADLMGTVRKKEIVVPRQVSMFLIRKDLGYSYEKIGEIFGGKNHTTVMHAFTKINRELKTDKNLMKHIAVLRRELNL